MICAANFTTQILPTTIHWHQLFCFLFFLFNFFPPVDLFITLDSNNSLFGQFFSFQLILVKCHRYSSAEKQVYSPPHGACRVWNREKSNNIPNNPHQNLQLKLQKVNQYRVLWESIKEIPCWARGGVPEEVIFEILSISSNYIVKSESKSQICQSINEIVSNYIFDLILSSFYMYQYRKMAKTLPSRF